MQLELWHIRGRGFHFGQHGLGLEVSRPWLSSDSLLAALLSRVAEWSGSRTVEAIVTALRAGSPAFAFTSAFPRAGQALFFPNPMGGEAGEGAKLKDLKKVALVSERTFRDRLSGQRLDQSMAHTPDGLGLNDGVIWVDHDDVSKLPGTLARGGAVWSVGRRPRVTVDRMAAASTLFFSGRTTYAPECGLWFGIHWKDRAFEPVVRQGLLDLGHTGLGGERGVGFGSAEIEAVGALELPDAGDDGHWVALGRYWPRADEVSSLRHPGAAYTIQAVGGWIGSLAYGGQRRKTIQMLAEGSVLGSAPRQSPGRLDDVRPTYPGNTNDDKHPIWRGGPIVAVGAHRGGT